MSAQKPMADRMQEMMMQLWQRPGGIRVDRLDKKVLKRLIKQGKAKITNGNGRAPIVNGRKCVMANHSLAVAVESLPIKEVADTGGPYAKRRAALEESGASYRGKSWGKKRVDLPREERERKIAEKIAKEKQMWAMLKHSNGNTYP